jgi:hypothetical protein
MRLAAVIDAMYERAAPPGQAPVEFWTSFHASRNLLSEDKRFHPLNISIGGRVPGLCGRDVRAGFEIREQRKEIFLGAIRPLIDALAAGELQLTGQLEPGGVWREPEPLPKWPLSNRAWIVYRQDSRVELGDDTRRVVAAFRNVALVVRVPVSSQQVFANLVVYLRQLAEANPARPTHTKAELWQQIRSHPRWQGIIKWDAYMAARAKAFADYPMWTQRGVRRAARSREK